jgi:hypothetical protein
MEKMPELDECFRNVQVLAIQAEREVMNVLVLM